MQNDLCDILEERERDYIYFYFKKVKIATNYEMSNKEKKRYSHDWFHPITCISRVTYPNPVERGNRLTKYLDTTVKIFGDSNQPRNT